MNNCGRFIFRYHKWAVNKQTTTNGKASLAEIFFQKLFGKRRAGQKGSQSGEKCVFRRNRVKSAFWRQMYVKRGLEAKKGVWEPKKGSGGQKRGLGAISRVRVWQGSEIGLLGFEKKAPKTGDCRAFWLQRALRANGFFPEKPIL